MKTLDRIRRAYNLLLEEETKTQSGTYLYGDNRTIQRTGWLDVETFQGTVVSVWYRCLMLPFNQHEVNGPRATSMEESHKNIDHFITGIQIEPFMVKGKPE